MLGAGAEPMNRTASYALHGLLFAGDVTRAQSIASCAEQHVVSTAHTL